jgi:hypothetical protein
LTRLGSRIGAAAADEHHRAAPLLALEREDGAQAIGVAEVADGPVGKLLVAVLPNLRKPNRN